MESNKKLFRTLEKAATKVISLQLRWQNAKRRHFKAWEAEYELWPDKKSQIEASKWERSAQEEVDRIATELKIAKENLKDLVKHAKAHLAEHNRSNLIHKLLKEIDEKNLTE